MLNIIACYKWVIDEAYIRKTPSGGLDFSTVDYKIGEYDRNAIEEAVRIMDACGGKVTALTAGVPESSKGVKDALSRGCDQACFAADASYRDLEPSQTADVLAKAIRSKLPYDLIICGEGSSDLYAQQVGPRLADYLGIPCVSFVQKMEIKDGKLIAERKTEDVTEIVEAPLPALVTVLPEINTPRIPGVKDTLMASKKTVINVGLEDVGPLAGVKLRVTGMAAAGMERNCVKFGNDAAGIKDFVNALRKSI
jgi:electron transfer flavoprotein beta subunit